MKRQIESIQCLRAFAAWVVVLHHVLQILFEPAMPEEGWIVRFLRVQGAMGVDLFFVISGFVIFISSRNEKSPFRFYGHRLIRLVPAYWLVTFVIAGTAAAFPEAALVPYRFSLDHFVRSLFFLPAQHPSGIGLFPVLTVGWSINYEMFFYLVFGGVLLLRAPLRLLITIGALFASLILARNGWLPGFYGEDLVFEFCFGLALGYAWEREWIRPNKIASVACLIATPLAFILMPSLLNLRVTSWGLPCLLFVAGLLLAEGSVTWPKWVKHAGDISYSTYLVHAFVLSSARAVAASLELRQVAAMVASLPMIVLFSWLSYQFVERGFGRWLRTKFDQKRYATAPEM